MLTHTANGLFPPAMPLVALTDDAAFVARLRAFRAQMAEDVPFTQAARETFGIQKITYRALKPDERADASGLVAAHYDGRGGVVIDPKWRDKPQALLEALAVHRARMDTAEEETAPESKSAFLRRETDGFDAARKQPHMARAGDFLLQSLTDPRDPVPPVTGEGYWKMYNEWDRRQTALRVAKRADLTKT